MSRQGVMCWVGLAGAVLVLGSVPAARAQAQPQAAQVVDRQYEIKTKFAYYLGAFVKPTQPAIPAGDAAIRIAVIGPKFERVLHQPGLNQPSIETAPLRNLKDRSVQWDGFRNLADLPRSGPQPNVLYFLRDDREIDAKLEDVSRRFPAPTAVLIITEQDDKFRKQAAVNFYEDKAANRLRIQLRKSSLEARGLEADPQLLNLQGVLAY